jgi:LysR substrate binding domain
LLDQRCSGECKIDLPSGGKAKHVAFTRYRAVALRTCGWRSPWHLEQATAMPPPQAAKEFRERFPGVPLRLFVEALGGAYQPVLDRVTSLGVVGSLPIMPPSLSGERLTGIAFVVVAARDHPLASVKGTIELAKHVQLVLTDRTSLSEGRSASCLLKHGDWPISLPNTPFCSTASVGAVCPGTPSNGTSAKAGWWSS